MAQNRLAQESSPYLLQHASNPVDWYPWCEDALKKARDENKPIFLSIGYSACHWCHVMAHESFENEDIAKVMNENFVNIKVDREERPDIDDIYQKACQLTTGGGGWPLSIFLTPDQRPFYVGTYFPPLDGYGRPGFGSLIRQLAQAWKEKQGDVEAAASNFVNSLKATESVPANSRLDRSVLDEAAMNLLTIGDFTNGGFGQAPKFPNSANLSFLLRYSKLSKISKFQEFVLKTLTKMANGGIYDQIGGGFHRYATDSKWLVPHFEKMLYDNALLPVVYAEAYQITKDSRYLEVVTETLRYVINEMTSPEGAFYSAQDADSEGHEGRYYLWKKRDIENILGGDADPFCLMYDVTDGGNFEGQTILNKSMGMRAVASSTGKSESELFEVVRKGKMKLLEERKKRTHPGRDEKILVGWNSLMISSFLHGYRITQDAAFAVAAENCIRFIEQKMMKEGELLHTYKDGTAKLRAYLDDYAYLVNAIVDYFEIKPSKRYLEIAKRCADYMLEHFWDENGRAFYFTADNHEKLLVRTKNIYDLSLPSGNSVAASAFLRLYHITQERRYLDVSVKIMESLSGMAAENPFGFGQLLNAIYIYLIKPMEITVLNYSNKELWSFLQNKFLPESILIGVESKEVLGELQQLPFFAGKNFDDSKTTVYVCKDFMCSLPVDTLQEVEKLL